MVSRALGALGSLVGLGAVATADTAHATTATWPTRVTAVYTVNVAGLEFGKFHYRSDVSGKTYRQSGHLVLTWGFGLFKWRGNTNSSGVVIGNGVKPADYAYDFKSNKKSGSVKLKFDHAGVSSVSLVPARGDEPGLVALKPGHLKSVFDPMSALAALSRVPEGSPCGRRIAVFDGKQRFDLAMTFRRQERVQEKRDSGQPPMAFVCGVRYIPVAGHKPNRENKMMATNKDIEVALRPIPAAGLAVPTRISVPTPVGSVEIRATKVEITGPDNRRIALSH